MKNSFIPNKNNHYHPHFFREKTVGFILILSLFLSLGTIFISQNRANGWLAQVISSTLIQDTNKERTALGLNQLETNSMLTTAAQAKADDMAQKGYFAHTTPDGKKPWDFISDSGYQFTNAGENLAINFIDSGKLHQAWMNSESHRKNILHKEFTEIGIGTAEGYLNGEPAIFVVQMFGRQKMSSSIFQIPIASASNTKERTTTIPLKNTQTASEIKTEPAFIELENANPEQKVLSFNIENTKTNTNQIKTTTNKKNTEITSQPENTMAVKITKSLIKTVRVLPIALLFLIIISLGLLIGVEIKRYNFQSIVYGLVMMTTVWGIVFIQTFLNSRGIIS